MSLKLDFHFNFDRSLQASAYLLKQAEKQELAYIHLLKMLYIADREYLSERGYMITGDKVVAMQKGPVLSRILDLIKGKGRQAKMWHRFIKHSLKKYYVQLIRDPGDGDLSRASMAKLDDVFMRFGSMKSFQVVRLTHDFSEWENHYTHGTSTHIPWQSILQAQNAEKMIQVVESQIKLQQHQQALQRICR